ncbi:hypothetical protein OAJ23_02300 [Pelagibacteraceae bacterium]|jgi:hypothetical protein|nr:hypothetical protein [Pelagibacteraceae bacterium]|tara:strand:+ start:2800 stop:2976 length:177 start_codon:yes stop_codon:yes gene_type:complete
MFEEYIKKRSRIYDLNCNEFSHREVKTAVDQLKGLWLKTGNEEAFHMVQAIKKCASWN